MPDSSELLQQLQHYQKSLTRYSQNGNDSRILYYILKLSKMPITVSHLEDTGIGRTVNSVTKLQDEAGEAARTLVAKWKEMVSENEGCECCNTNGEKEFNNGHHKIQEESKDTDSSHKHSDKLKVVGMRNKKHESSSESEKYHESPESEASDKQSKHKHIDKKVSKKSSISQEKDYKENRKYHSSHSESDKKQQHQSKSSSERRDNDSSTTKVSTNKRKRDKSPIDDDSERKNSKKSSSHSTHILSHSHGSSQSSQNSNGNREYKENRKHKEESKSSLSSNASGDIKPEKKKHDSHKEDRQRIDDKSKKVCVKSEKTSENSSKDILSKSNKHSCKTSSNVKKTPNLVHIGSESGISFADALNMLEPPKPTTSKSSKKPLTQKKIESSHKTKKIEKSEKKEEYSREKPSKSDKIKVVIPPSDSYSQSSTNEKSDSRSASDKHVDKKSSEKSSNSQEKDYKEDRKSHSSLSESDKKHRHHSRSSSERKHNDSSTTKDSSNKRKRDKSPSDDDSDRKKSKKSSSHSSRRLSNSHRCSESSQNSKGNREYKESRKHKKESKSSSSSKSKGDIKPEKKKQDSHEEDRQRIDDKCKVVCVKSEKTSASSSEENKSKSSKTNKHSSKISSNVKKTPDLVDIGSESGTSFADALGMLEPPKPTTNNSSKKPVTQKPLESSHKTEKMEKSKKKEKSEKREEYSKEKRSKSDKIEVIPPPPTQKMDIDISSLLPSITPNHRPVTKLFVDSANTPNNVMNEGEVVNMMMSQKNMRTKVYSGNKSLIGNVPTLFELCIRVLRDNIEALEYTGGVPYGILKPILDKATPDQLFMLEHHNPYIIEDTDNLWQFHCSKEFKNENPMELESWREMYMRCLNEREAKLKVLTENSKLAQDKAAHVRQTKLAYVDSVVKPPRNVFRKQAKHGIDKKPIVTPTTRLNSIVAAGTPGQVAVPNHVRASSSGTSNSLSAAKQRKAPLMLKTLAFLNGNRFRR